MTMKIVVSLVKMAATSRRETETENEFPPTSCPYDARSGLQNRCFLRLGRGKLKDNLAMSWITELLWEGLPTREEEDEYIRDAAAEWKDKNVWDRPPLASGFELRSHRSTVEVFQKLAVLQTRYYATDDRDEWRRLFRHATLLIVPMLGAGQKRICQNTGKPCTKLKDDRKNGIVRCQLRSTRLLLAFQILVQHAQKKGPPQQSGYSWPIISVRERQRGEIWDGLQGKPAEQRRAKKVELVGVAVLKEYRKHNGRPGNTIEAAQQAVVDQGQVDGIDVGGIDNVRALYKEYRQSCFQRGYADERPFWAEVNGEPWPEDQVWLSDFPQNQAG